MIVTLLLWRFILATQKYESNLIKLFDNTITPSFQCQESLLQSKISFSQPFVQIPKVFLSIEKFYIEPNVNYQVYVTSITLIDFVINLDCPTQSNVMRIWIRWYAIDSPHLEVIDCFSSSCPIALEQQFSHSVPYALSGFISLTSFQSTGPVDFVIKISSITETTVTTKLSSMTNLISIGYQIILSFKAAILGYVEEKTTAPLTKSNVITEVNQFLLVLFLGFSYPNENNFSLDVSIMLFTSSSRATIRITYSGQSYDKFVTNTYFYILLPYLFTEFGQTFKINHLNIRSFYDIEYQTHKNIELKIWYTSPLYSEIGVYTFNPKVSFYYLNMDVYLKCSKQCRLKSKFNFCDNCLNQKPYEQIKQLNGELTIMKYLTRYTSYEKALKDIRITITNTSLEVVQIVYSNIAQIQQTILLIQIENL